ncbi:MAG: RNA-binding protein [bacterium]|nr:RNA-binding protein [bacterium]
MRCLNFYSPIYHGNLMAREKTCTIRLGDKRDKYREGDLVWVTYGERFQPRRKLFPAVLDRVDLKPIAELGEADLAGENPDMKTTADVVAFLGKIYHRELSPAELVTVIYFSEVTE